ncbi:MAG: methionine ABC transporter permease [Erysipelotrichaceae bacterium]
MISPALLELLMEGTFQTMYMVLGSLVLSFAFGLPLGVFLYITRSEGVFPKQRLNRVLEYLVNIVRSIPFVILMVWMFPLTRLLVGTSIGASAAIVPLTFGAIPFVARLVETSLLEIDKGMVEAARVMGATPVQIVSKVLLPEAFPSLVKQCGIVAITLMAYSAMAGLVGAGGLGDIAIRYGLYRYESTMMNYTIVVIIVLVQLMQSSCNWAAKKIDKR